MMKKKNKIDLRKFRKILPYILTGAITLAVVAVGYINKYTSGVSLSLDAFAEENYKISVDQLSGLYTVASVSDALNLASASNVASNYVIASSMYAVGQISPNKPEKPPITNIVTSRGVVEYVVQEGESMEAIAAKYGVSTDQIRWSNGKKTTAVSAGDVLYVPSKPGIVYTVKSGDTIEGIVGKYGSTVAEVIAFNDLEASGITEGMRILISGGSLPETERPEYVAPVPTYNYTYTYLGSSSSRQNITTIATNFYVPDGNYLPPSEHNPGYRGNCTWYAWYWRATDPRSLGKLAGGATGNAGYWNISFAYRGVGNTPAVGAVFQTPYGGGGYGHVGVVIALNGDGSIVIQEMNYAGWSVVTEATIPASHVGNFNYIH